MGRLAMIKTAPAAIGPVARGCMRSLRTRGGPGISAAGRLFPPVHRKAIIRPRSGIMATMIADWIGWLASAIFLWALVSQVRTMERWIGLRSIGKTVHRSDRRKHRLRMCCALVGGQVFANSAILMTSLVGQVFNLRNEKRERKDGPGNRRDGDELPSLRGVDNSDTQTSRVRTDEKFRWAPTRAGWSTAQFIRSFSRFRQAGNPRPRSPGHAESCRSPRRCGGRNLRWKDAWGRSSDARSSLRHGAVGSAPGDRCSGGGCRRCG